MTPLDALIRKEIAAEGPMTVARFMDLALQHQDYGYYRARDPLGQAGDFTTAPEISQMFGEMIGVFLAEAWRALGSPRAFTLLELGPGRGTLMADALRATKRVEGFHEALSLAFLESNTVLREKQKKALAPFAPTYLEDLEALPDQPVLALANEFFDALPVRQFSKSGKAWKERFIAVDGEVLYFKEDVPEKPFKAPQDDGLTYWEESTTSALLLRGLAEKIEQKGGAALIIDYGYAMPPDALTLQAVSKQTQADPLQNVGETDLTAHVNFGALARIGAERGLSIWGPEGQGAFLEAMGIGLRAELLKRNATPAQAKEIDSALARLTSEAEMGTLFKVLALASEKVKEVPGFP